MSESRLPESERFPGSGNALIFNSEPPSWIWNRSRSRAKFPSDKKRNHSSWCQNIFPRADVTVRTPGRFTRNRSRSQRQFVSPEPEPSKIYKAPHPWALNSFFIPNCEPHPAQFHAALVRYQLIRTAPPPPLLFYPS